MAQSFQITFAKSSKSGAETAVVFTDGDGKLLTGGLALDKKAGGLLSAALAARGGFKGKAGETLTLFLPKAAGYTQVVVAGLGKGSEALETENTGGKILAALKAAGAKGANILFDLPKDKKADAADTAAALASGIQLRAYAFDKYKQGNKKKKTGDGIKNDGLKTVTIVTEAATAAAKAYQTYDAVNEGVRFARDLVNEVPNVLYPESYAALVQKELKPLGVQVEIIDHKKMQKLGFGAHLAVGMGSARPPCVVIMRWNGTSSAAKKSSKTPLAFVGKGVTFDTGGISIKPAAGMEEMKMDMGGSAAVVGLIRALAVRKAKVDVIGIVGLAENMPSDRAYRPGDIVTSLSGKTIEVLNTDAEGRLVLCDALTYVQDTYKPSMIVDLATLTGAIMVALGYEYAGAFVNDDKLWSQLDAAGKQTGEKLWRMPLDEAYREEMRSKVADLQNLGNLGRYGGACSAAGFLEQFVEAKTPWAHLDIAGTAWGKSDKAITPRGGSGFGVRLLYRFVLSNYAG